MIASHLENQLIECVPELVIMYFSMSVDVLVLVYMSLIHALLL